jgi:hypothetical protein
MSPRKAFNCDVCAFFFMLNLDERASDPHLLNVECIIKQFSASLVHMIRLTCIHMRSVRIIGIQDSYVSNVCIYIMYVMTDLRVDLFSIDLQVEL